MHPFIDPSDDDDGDGEDAAQVEFREQMDKLRERYEREDLDDHLRKIGLYVHTWDVVPYPVPGGYKPVLVISAAIGDLAFSTTSLDPESDQFDREFRNMMVASRQDDFLDVRQKIEKALTEGRDPFDLDEEDDDGTT